MSAHQAIDAEAQRWESVAQLAAEYDEIAATAQPGRWEQVLRTSGLSQQEADSVLSSPAMGPLAAAVRRAGARGLRAEDLVPDDVVAVLAHRVEARTTRHRGRGGGQVIAGLLPEALGVDAPEMAEALRRRGDLIEERARDLAEAAVASRPPWTRPFGPPPADCVERRRWLPPRPSWPPTATGTRRSPLPPHSAPGRSRRPRRVTPTERRPRSPHSSSTRPAGGPPRQASRAAPAQSLAR
ncbi:hypothetical protein [Xylanimonas ulmi]|uniref:hypothetical protein n=1 Tax=Xylanimonas ulmi TaxID=228973 RepID=UPI00102C22CA|nr:hypothetical protein [Xylanibacterium ulmi]